MLISIRKAQILLFVLLFLFATQTFSCPFCSSSTREEPLHLALEGQQIAALVRPIGDVPKYAEMLRARNFGAKILNFEVETVLRDSGELAPGKQFKA